MPLSLLLILAALVTLAACVEFVNLLAREFLVGWFREDSLKESIRRAEKDLVETKRKIDTLNTTLKAANAELARSHESVAEIERTLAQRRILPPVLVLSNSSPNPRFRRFRASITKKLRDGATPQQSQFWARPCFVEIAAASAQSAQADARVQYPREQGYVIGPFAEAPREPAGHEEAAA